jgi:hypothetical protein
MMYGPFMSVFREFDEMNNCFVNWSLLLEFIKVFLTWPSVTLVIFLLCIWKFGRQISALLGRLKRWKAGGHEIELEPLAQQKPGDISGDPIDPSDHLSINANDPEKAKSEILKWWSAARYEAVVNRIFGSQLRLLQHLVLKVPTGDQMSNVQQFYGQHISLTANSVVTPSANDAYFEFLKFYGLIETKDIAGATWIKITPIGQEFLTYARAQYGDSIEKKLW